MAAQLNTAGEEQGPAIAAPDARTQHRDDEHHQIEHSDEARSENVTARGMP